MDTDLFFSQLWQRYVQLAPQAARIRTLFGDDDVVNDHVAFRTFDHSPIQLAELETVLFGLGYQRHAPYEFPDKHLSAWGYVPAWPDDPLVFLSELHVAALSPASRAIVERAITAISGNLVIKPAIFMAGRLWPAVTRAEYKQVAAESEYAGWLLAHGLTANHFTVAMHKLTPPLALEEAVARVEAAGFAINSAGGKIKGTPDELLEQASTLADRIEIRFADGPLTIPTCYYEFARRYPDADGALYQGFVAASANRIFESTDFKGGGMQ
ncbi:DUF1338 domain-containing protein [Andreprevotia chitinilytica]|uniref:DUF1338 domain-containing protein n=1 Tax=Andreprevotia chitinilytica TaxID=396808 RepID=UPI000554C6C4|nr:DUF1338 domain-containing protein [Andreprevotia chitinilytica]